MRVIKFEKKDCAPCKQVDQYAEKIGLHFDETINAFDEPLTAARYKVKGLPAVILVGNDNVEIRRSVGFNQEQLDSIKKELNRP